MRRIAFFLVSIFAFIFAGPAWADTTDDIIALQNAGLSDEVITAWDWARRLDTIAYEVVCGIGPRVPRVYV